MARVILDQQSVTKLRAIAEPAEICDEHGAVVGIYAPVADRELYAGADSPASEDELQRSELDPARSLSEILRDLASR